MAACRLTHAHDSGKPENSCSGLSAWVGKVKGARGAKTPKYRYIRRTIAKSRRSWGCWAVVEGLDSLVFKVTTIIQQRPVSGPGMNEPPLCSSFSLQHWCE
ncbi:hypothetical protein CGCF415_v000291 [Colletotrichum fructicola]|nr:hypothetical protein CGCFRS4_v000180 [Colletotrichum fructicola]KAF4917252.1 hypothetical protein CGCF415_v000291 [Colletotrichum fructicola]KAF4942126.1 hypothetical protein CGCF245_v000802 [Colletotrichum fructicola]